MVNHGESGVPAASEPSIRVGVPLAQLAHRWRNDSKRDRTFVARRCRRRTPDGAYLAKSLAVNAAT
jgi:hypothetical protein